MADPPPGAQIATNTIETEQTTTGHMSPANDSVVEILDGSTNKSTGGTSRATSSVIEVVNDNSYQAAGDEPPASNSMDEGDKDDSRKRKATEHDQNTPFKKQKPARPENSGIKADQQKEKVGHDETESTAAADGSSKDSQQESTAASQAGDQKPKPQYNSIEEVREKANKLLVEKKAEIKELKDEVADLEKEKELWQRRAGTSEGKLKHWEKTQDAQEKVLWDKALDWKKKEVGKQVDKAKASWQKKFDTQSTRIATLQQRLDDSRSAHEETGEELRQTKATLKEQISNLKKQIKNYRPGDSKELKLKIKELDDRENLLEAQKATTNVLAERLEDRNADLARVREQRLHWYNKAQTYHKEWEKEIRANDQLKVEHEEELQQQYKKWQVQANNSAENQVRLVARQRGNFDLNNANERLIQEKEQLRKQLKAAEAQIQQLQSSAAPQPPRPAQVLPTTSDTIRTQTCRLRETQTQETVPKVYSGAESSRATGPPEAEVTSQQRAAESRAKTEVDATVDNDRQVTQIVNGIVDGDAQPPQGEPHSQIVASNIVNEASGDVGIDVESREAVTAAPEAPSQDMQAPTEVAWHGGEGEVSDGLAADQIQGGQTASEHAGHDEEDESFAEASKDQIQNMQAAVQYADEHAGHAQDQFSIGPTDTQAEDVQTGHQGAGPSEEATASQATEQTERKNPEPNERRPIGRFYFPDFPSMWRSDRSG